MKFLDLPAGGREAERYLAGESDEYPRPRPNKRSDLLVLAGKRAELLVLGTG